ncbi:hypothetical protein MMAG44476_08511 [Mycolicibacterium mageritense DSM 44476 = CIP 104973]|uniref:hypothetical protein n=1 Tax=Mycolicibacterium TaxID=1866885 RepID=UPI000559FCD8|nr:hypothetical protein [Mycolicibacterium mageritense]MBN3457465.1 hypothetical protein [Mycobacterium sp. DSM 3803]MCC9183568.1 hypothetical protein [Mycolicibacterium mageritense]
MSYEADVANVQPPDDALPEQPAARTAAQPEPPVEQPPESAQPDQQDALSMPKPSLGRRKADDIGRASFKAISGIARFMASAARYGAVAATKAWRGLETVPTAGKLFSSAILAFLLGIFGAVALDSVLGLLCTVVVVPASAGVLGALGCRWYGRLSVETAPRTYAHQAERTDSELQRSVQYVDRKLTLAITSLGTEHHHQAVIALFQAKTAAELTLGTEQDLASYGDISLRPEDYGLRPKIRSGASSAARESTSLAS